MVSNVCDIAERTYTTEEARKISAAIAAGAPSGSRQPQFVNGHGDYVYFSVCYCPAADSPIASSRAPMHRPEPKANEYRNPRRQARPK